MSERYRRSEELLERALRTVPLGSQTFSKSKTQYPQGISPYFAASGKGSHFHDVDGNEYVDFVCGLASITLGYADPDVNAAVAEQLEKGTIFSIASELEFEVAEAIVDMVPCAEMVRFGKNGSDATAGAVRLARAWTGRDIVLQSGYHGWQDWYIGTTTRDLGVPKATKELTRTFAYNDIASLERLFNENPGKVAAVILEPVNVFKPVNNFLEQVKELTHKNDALLIFDETITGFRYANGGAQEFFNVVPDLATFGKGLANGFPLSAVAGRADLMKLMEEIFFSFTFGGETLSLAASKAVLSKMKREPVVQHIREMGELTETLVNERIAQSGMADVFSVSGYPAWSFFMMKDAFGFSSWEMKSLMMQEVLSRGVLAIGTHNICYAHTPEDIQRLADAYSAFFDALNEARERKDIRSMLRCEPIEPLFKVR